LRAFATDKFGFDREARYNPHSPSMLRKKEILQGVYERCGQKTHAKLVKVNAADKMVNKEL